MYRIVLSWSAGPDEQGLHTGGSWPTFYLDPLQYGIRDAAGAEGIASNMARRLFALNSDCGCAGELHIFVTALFVPVKELGE